MKYYPVVLYPELLRDFVAREKSIQARVKLKSEFERRRRESGNRPKTRFHSLVQWFIEAEEWIEHNFDICRMVMVSSSVLFAIVMGGNSGSLNYFVIMFFLSIILQTIPLSIISRIGVAFRRRQKSEPTFESSSQIVDQVDFVSDRSMRLKRLLSKVSVLKPGVVSTAQKGVSEEAFFKVLRSHFSVQWGGEFPIPGSQYRYSADIQLMHPTGLCLDIEIDEPYEGRSGTPHHCVDDGKDQRRNEFFLNGYWVVVRFAEIQVVQYPYECAIVIGRVLADITGDSSYLLSGAPLPSVKLWTIAQAKKMARSQFRKSYLPGWGKSPRTRRGGIR